jgi:hypothetical protein
MFQDFVFKLKVAALLALFFGGIFFAPTLDIYARYYWNMIFGKPAVQHVAPVSVNQNYELPYGWQLHGFLCREEVPNTPCKKEYTIGNQSIGWNSASTNEVTIDTVVGPNIVWIDQTLDLNGDVPIKLIVRRPAPGGDLLVLVLIPQ